MGKLKESTIQGKALEILKNYYSKREKSDAISACKEAWTKKEKGGKRADGLISFKTKQGEYYTVTFEAKSHKTLGALISSVNEDKLGWHSLLASVGVIIFTGFVFIIFLDIKWWITLLCALPIGFITLMCFILLLDKLDLKHHRINSVIEQLKQYPANEQWVVYSKHADNLLATVASNGRKSHLKMMDLLCDKNGFGLMLISNKKTHILRKPKTKKGNYLSFYCSEQKIVAALENNKTEKLTPSTSLA